ncbi:MAG: ATP12 family chaperone protein [Sphingopyxis sp.]
MARHATQPQRDHAGMKRFYTHATTHAAAAATTHAAAAATTAAATHTPAPAGFTVHLDGRPIKTPKRAPLVVPTRALADAMAGEWAAQGENIVPATMPMTGMANAAIDIIAPDCAAFAAPLAAYGETDLLCYRAPEDDLAAHEAAHWNPVMDWAERHYGVEFTLVSGIVHAAQPPRTLAQLAHALHAHNAFALAALSPIITIGGSLICALALAEGAFGAEQLWDVVTLDEIWQEQQWSAVDGAEEACAIEQDEWHAAAHFLAMLSA